MPLFFCSECGSGIDARVQNPAPSILCHQCLSRDDDIMTIPQEELAAMLAETPTPILNPHPMRRLRWPW